MSGDGIGSERRDCKATARGLRKDEEKNQHRNAVDCIC